MLALALSLSLAAGPVSTTVVVTRRTAVSAPDGLELANEVAQALVQAGVPVEPSPAEANRRLANLGVKDSSACQGRKPCIVEFGNQLAVKLFVSVSVSEFEGERSVALEAYRIPEGDVLSKTSFFFSRTARPAAQDLDDFAARTRAALEPLMAQAGTPGLSDAPKKTDLTPLPSSQPDLTQAPEGPGHTGSFVVGGAAAAALVAAGVLGLTGLMTMNKLSDHTGTNRSVFTASQADAQAKSANLQLSASGICALVGAGLGTTAVVLW